jgi:hypothetical protein
LYLDNSAYYSAGGSQSRAQHIFGEGYTWCNILNFAIQIVSGVFILFAVFAINKIMKKGLKPSQIDSKNMALHTGAFSLYLFGLVIDSIFFINYMLIKGTYKAYQNFIIVQAISNFFNFLSQLILCKILYDLGKPMPKRAKSSSERGSVRQVSERHSATLTSLSINEDEDNIRKADQQARLWNQFMRGPLHTDSVTDSVEHYFIDGEQIAYYGMGLVMDERRKPSLLDLETERRGTTFY